MHERQPPQLNQFIEIDGFVGRMEKNELPGCPVQGLFRRLGGAKNLAIPDHFDLRIFPPQIVQNLGSRIRRKVVDQNQLNVPAQFTHSFQQYFSPIPDIRLAIAYRHDDADRFLHAITRSSEVEQGAGDVIGSPRRWVESESEISGCNEGSEQVVCE